MLQIVPMPVQDKVFTPGPEAIVRADSVGRFSHRDRQMAPKSTLAHGPTHNVMRSKHTIVFHDRACASLDGKLAGNLQDNV